MRAGTVGHGAFGRGGSSMFNGKNILITGGTGSFGRQFADVLLKTSSAP